jgi:hypothetical protein
MWGLRHFVTRFVNPVTWLFAGSAPGFGVLTYQCRISGKMYNTPVNVFRRGDDYIFFLTYGSDAEWVKNPCGRRMSNSFAGPYHQPHTTRGHRRSGPQSRSRAHQADRAPGKRHRVSSNAARTSTERTTLHRLMLQ